MRALLDLRRERASVLVGCLCVAGAVFYLRGQSEDLLHFRRDFHARIHFHGDGLTHALPVHRQPHGIRSGSGPWRIDARVGAMRNRGASASASTAARTDRIVVQIPAEAMHPRRGFQYLLGGGPVERQIAIGRRGCLLADFVVGNWIGGRVGTAHRVGTTVDTDYFALAVQHIERHRAIGRVRQVIIDQRARRRILAG